MSIKRWTVALIVAVSLPAAAFAQSSKTNDQAQAQASAEKPKDKDKKAKKEADPNAPKLICERETSVDSFIGKRVCRTEKEIEESSRSSQDSLSAIRNGGSLGQNERFPGSLGR